MYDSAQAPPMHEESLGRVIYTLKRNIHALTHATFVAANGALCLQGLRITDMPRTQSRRPKEQRPKVLNRVRLNGAQAVGMLSNTRVERPAASASSARTE